MMETAPTPFSMFLVQWWPELGAGPITHVQMEDASMGNVLLLRAWVSLGLFDAAVVRWDLR